MAEDPNDVLRQSGADVLRKRIDTASNLAERPKPEAAKVIAFNQSIELKLSEESIALEFAEAHKHKLRFVAAWNRWMRFENGLWRPDETYATFDSIRPIIRARSSNASQQGSTAAQNRAVRMASSQTVAGVEKLAKADRRLASSADAWDQAPSLLGVPGGVVDLANGTLREAAPEDYITRRASVAPSPSCATPVWDAFIQFVTDGDPEFAGFLQRMCGYCLTGSVEEQVLFFLYGPGGNGKSVFIDVLARILGDYWQNAAMDTFIDTGRHDHPTDLAMLRGARLVTAQETQSGRRWHETRIKQLTGSDPVTARFMRADFFTYRPQFKLVFCGNHKPSLANVDDAIRRRMRLMPFDQIVPEDRRDVRLLDKLMGEGPGILNWMLEGCLAWQAQGIGTCDRVEQATQDYLNEEDLLGSWIEECCHLSPDAFAASSSLFAHWSRWAERAGERVGSQKAFSQALQQRGFQPVRQQRRRGFVGISIERKQE